MPDNVNITVNETIENIVVNPSITTEVIDVNITGTTETVNIDVTPNLTTVNINSISGSPVTKTSDLINDGEDGINPFITLNDIPPVTGFVPYTGATQDVNLGEFGVQLGNLEFDTTPTNIPTGVGSLVWNDTAGTLDLKLKGNAVTLQIGQETVARVVNKTATNIPLLEANYQIVRVTGAQGQRPKVDLALANNDLNSTTTLGLVTETILNNQEGFITTSGQVQQINTTGSLQGETWADGDVLYLSGTVAGRATNIKPIAPIHTVIIGFVEYAHITQGKIFVKVDNGYELEELHNVSAIAPNNNEVLTYDSATLLWKPKTVVDALGFTPENVANKSTLTTLGTSNTLYPTQNAVKVYADTKFTLPTLTSGSVLFSNGTTIAQDNTNFFWDDTNNRLGIGTITPTYKLDVRGNMFVKNATDTDATALFGTNGGGFSIEVANRTDIKLKTNAIMTSRGTGITFRTTVGEPVTATLGVVAPGALSTDIALRVRNSADTGDLATIGGTGILTVGGVGNKATINLARESNGGIMGAIIQPADFTEFYNYQGSGFKFYVTAATTLVRAFITNRGLGITGTTGGVFTLDASALLQANSTTQGFLPPRMTNAQRIAIAAPAVGLCVYCTDAIEGLYINKSTGWTFIG